MNQSRDLNMQHILIRNESIVSLLIDGELRVCLSQLSSTLLFKFSYNEIHNRRVALGINCVQCSPRELEILRANGAMPVNSRRCGMITEKEAKRLVNSFYESNQALTLPSNFVFNVEHRCGFGASGLFSPSRYNSSRAKCIRCAQCQQNFSPNKFVFHMHATKGGSYLSPESNNFNSWRRYITLVDPSALSEEHLNAWENVKSIFNSGKRKRSYRSPACETVNKKSHIEIPITGVPFYPMLNPLYNSLLPGILAAMYNEAQLKTSVVKYQAFDYKNIGTTFDKDMENTF